MIAASIPLDTKPNVSRTCPELPVIKPTASVTTMCISSCEPPTCVAYEDVPGADVNNDLNCHDVNCDDVSQTETLIELPNAPGYLAANEP